MKRISLLGLVLLVTSLSGCGVKLPILGAERDAKGCLPSAGYMWCTKTARCERPWELAREHNFTNTPAAFKQYCQNP